MKSAEIDIVITAGVPKMDQEFKFSNFGDEMDGFYKVAEIKKSPFDSCCYLVKCAKVRDLPTS